MSALPIGGNQKAVGISILAGAVLLAAGVYLPTNISIFGGGIKNACMEWKNEMTEYAKTSPTLTGEYNGVTDSGLEEWKIKGDKINKKLFNALGIPYKGIENRNIYDTPTGQLLNNIQLNTEGMMKAAEKCKNVGVDFNTSN